MKRMLFTTICAFALLSTASNTAHAQAPEWRYFAPDNTGVGGEIHNVITEDRTGALIGTGYHVFYNRGCVYRYRNGVYTNWGTKDGYLSDDRVNDIVFTKTNDMWIATDSGVVNYNGKTWKYYSTANSGLLYNQIISLAIDPKTQHIWATTRQFKQPTNTAVSVFDGSKWTNYNTTTIGTVPLTLLGNIAIDANGTKWIAYSRGLIKYDGKTWKILDNSNSALSDYEVMRVQVDAANNLWCVSGNGSQKGTGIDILNIGTNKWSQLGGLPVTNASPGYIHVRGNKLLVVEEGFLGRIFIRDGQKWSTLPGNGDQAFGAFIDTLGQCWIPGKGFIKMYDGKQWKRYTQQSSGLAEFSSQGVFVDSKNRKWFANGNGGIQIFDCPRWEVIGPRNEGHWPTPQLQTPVGTSITEDKGNGDIWITYTGTNGLAVRIPNGNTANNAAWKTYANSSLGINTGQLSFSFIEQVKANNRGQVAFINSAGAGGHVFLFDRVADTWTTFKTTAEGGPIPGTANCIGADTAGTFYVGTFQKVMQYSGGKWTALNPTAQGGPADFKYVYTIAFDSKNNMWVGTSDGIWMFNGTKWTHWNETNSALTGPQVKSIAFHGNKVFAAAYNVINFPYGGGLSVYDGVSWTGMMHGTNPMAHYQVEQMATDTLGNLWISTIEGVNVYRKGGTSGFSCLDDDRAKWESLSASVTVPGNDASSGSILVLYPNPAKERVMIKAEMNHGQDVDVSIYDMTGRLVKRVFTGTLEQGANELSADVKDLAPGLYMCILTANDERQAVKLMIQ